MHRGPRGLLASCPICRLLQGARPALSSSERISHRKPSPTFATCAPAGRQGIVSASRCFGKEDRLRCAAIEHDACESMPDFGTIVQTKQNPVRVEPGLENFEAETGKISIRQGECPCLRSRRRG